MKLPSNYRWMMHVWVFLCSVAILNLNSNPVQGEIIGKRPYEMEWVGRQVDDHPPLIDFEDLTGWRVEATDAIASFVRSREQQLWGKYVGKLTYRGNGPNPKVLLCPPKPIAITNAFDAVTLWVYGNNWGWATDPATPQVDVSVVFSDAAGEEMAVSLWRVDWMEWFLLHKRLGAEGWFQSHKGLCIKAIQITDGRNAEDRTLYFDNLAVFKESLSPLQFEPRPERGISMLPGQSKGANIGPGKLPFPTREKTILPDTVVSGSETSLIRQGQSVRFLYQGPDGTLEYQCLPQTGRWDDWTVKWHAKGRYASTYQFTPCLDGGIQLVTGKGVLPPQTARLLDLKTDHDSAMYDWEVGVDQVTAVVRYVYRLWGKSLVVDVMVDGGKVGEVRFGHARGLPSPRLVTNPFYPASGQHPAVVAAGETKDPLFVTGHVDWYMSNGSILWAANSLNAEGVVYHGGTRYLPKTDGVRNPVFERFFLTVSPHYIETLPNIPNPASPWKNITGTHVWRAHGASVREHDRRYWAEVHRYGMTQMVITDHETGWRDGGESFTFRTRPAPGKGGDEGQYDYARWMQDTLGFVYGPYNNYTDFAPVNEYWSPDMISRQSDGQLQHAWMRCYAPKPQRAVEYCARLAPIIQDKFHFSTAYCDVHTAVPPWDRVDYDVRVPGAGTFAAVFYAYGEIMLHQKKAWNGPVYSEGNNHCFYSGLTDGNYGQDQPYRPAENPWLVDFDLRKMHDLNCNFGMGNPEMFYSNVPQPQRTPEERDAWLDRFLAATVAFGHPGFLVMEGGMTHALRSYYLLQQLHSRYCLTNVADIRYADAQGALLETSAAVASGAFKRSQVVTRYADGTITVVNGHRTERLKTQVGGRHLDLPPNGFMGWTDDGSVIVSSSDIQGHRADYAATPAYLYVDGRGRFARFSCAASQGIGVCRILGEGRYEIIPYQNAECGFAINAESVVAVDKDRKELGNAGVRVSRGLTYVRPVAGAFSYLVAGKPGRPATRLRCQRDKVCPGEVVRVKGRRTHTITIPADSIPGQRLWFPLEEGWIDFTVMPLAETTLSVADGMLDLEYTANTIRETKGMLKFGPHEEELLFKPGVKLCKKLRLGEFEPGMSELVTMVLQAGESRQTIETGLTASLQYVPLMPLPSWTGGICLRGGSENTEIEPTGAQITAGLSECGTNSYPGIVMHPPYLKGVGYAYALYDEIKLPVRPSAVFRSWVGKRNGSHLGDGILYQVVVEDAGKDNVVAECIVTNHVWHPIEADLSPWAGKTIRLKLIADVGRANDSSGDWACWGNPRIESVQRMTCLMVDPQVEKYRREAGPYPIAHVRQEDLRHARAVWMHFDGKGLEGPGAHGVTVELNGVGSGVLPRATGDEARGVFFENASLQLPAAVSSTLTKYNRLVLKNPGGDCYSIRRLWLEVELADGRKCSSMVNTPTFSQPGEWIMAEGVGIPAGDDVTSTLTFDH